MSLVKDAWRLAKDFFFDKEQRFKANSLLIGAILLDLVMVYIDVRFNQWHAGFYNSLQNLDKAAFYNSLLAFAVISFTYITFFICKFATKQKLIILWRQWLSEQYLAHWVKKDAYYRLHCAKDYSDNPDQRISEDIKLFVESSILLTLGLLSAIITLISFITILWSLSGILKFALFGRAVTIHGYLVWVVLIYAFVGTYITYKIGRNLSLLDYLQEKKEANFRFSLMRLRENSESIALYSGDRFEFKVFKRAFSQIVENFNNLIKINVKLGTWQSFYGQIAIIFPILVCSSRLFAKEITLGTLMQIGSAFGKVKESLSFLIMSFNDIATYRAVIKRLTEFNNAIDMCEREAGNNPIKISQHSSANLLLKNLTICSPEWAILQNNLNLEFVQGQSYLITGNNGCGKSTLIKAIRGLWLYGEGEILLPEQQKIFYLPQKIYMPSGTLLEAIYYPADTTVDVEIVKTLMNKAGIGYLNERLLNEENWSVALSLGEQQKISILRSILARPNIIIMDEATSAITESDEQRIFGLLKEELSNITLISVGHRATLRQFHNHEIKLS